eukprot:14710626-Ditylum_brightwellii.AAC.1
METIGDKVDGSYVCPNMITYNAVLNKWYKSGDHHAAENAEALLCKIEKQYQSGMVFVKPDVIPFITIIHVYSKITEPDAAQKAEKILMHMERHKQDGQKEWSPNRFSYKTSIEAWTMNMDLNRVYHICFVKIWLV